METFQQEAELVDFGESSCELHMPLELISLAGSVQVCTKAFFTLQQTAMRPSDATAKLFTVTLPTEVEWSKYCVPFLSNTCSCIHKQ